jgi:hypothetical protein
MARGCPLIHLLFRKIRLPADFRGEAVMGAEIIPHQLDRYHERVRSGYEIFASFYPIA